MDDIKYIIKLHKRFRNQIPVGSAEVLYAEIKNMSESERKTRKIYCKSQIESQKNFNTSHFSTMFFSLLSITVSFIVIFTNIGKEISDDEKLKQLLFGWLVLYTVIMVLATVVALYGVCVEHKRKREIQDFCFYLSAIEEYERNHIEEAETTYKVVTKKSDNC